MTSPEQKLCPTCAKPLTCWVVGLNSLTKPGTKLVTEYQCSTGLPSHPEYVEPGPSFTVPDQETLNRLYKQKFAMPISFSADSPSRTVWPDVERSL